MDRKQTPNQGEPSSADSEWQSRLTAAGTTPSVSSSSDDDFESQLRAKHDQQALLVEVNSLLARAADAKEALSPILTRLKERGGLLSASIYLLDGEKRELRCAAREGPSTLEPEDGIPVEGPGIVAEAARMGEALCSPVADRDSRPRARSGGAEAEYATPLRGGTGIVGVLYITSGDAEGIRATFRKLVDQLAAQVALAIERSTFYERLRASESLFGSMFAQGDFGAVLLSLEGTFSNVNPAFARLLGCEPKELLGVQLLDCAYPDDRADLGERLEQLVVGKAPCFSTELRLRRQSGEPVWCLITVSMIRDSDGAPLYGLAVVHDISGRKSAEEERARLQAQLFHAQKMEAMGRLAEGVAHEFNNLLGVIMGFTSLARGRLQSGDPLLEPLSMIAQTAALAGELARKLLGFARPEKPQLRAVQADAILSRIATIVMQTFDRRIHVDTHLAPTPAWVRGDESLLEQALLNLCINARDAMPQGGTLTLASSRQTLDPQDPRRPADSPAGDYVRIAVRDTGSGIDPQLLPRIFEPFVTTKEPTEGTGLGLATVYTAVKNQGGFVQVSSELGQGAEFAIYLPAAEPPEDPDPIGALPESLERGSGTILVVDDEPLMRVFIEKGLQAVGYDVLTAEGGEAACKLFEADGRGVDCVLLDMVMPGMSWLDVCRRLRQINPQVKMVLASGHGDPRKAHAALGLGPLEFIAKPFSLETLARFVGAVLGGGQKEGHRRCES